MLAVSCCLQSLSSSFCEINIFSFGKTWKNMNQCLALFISMMKSPISYDKHNSLWSKATSVPSQIYDTSSFENIFFKKSCAMLHRKLWQGNESKGHNTSGFPFGHSKDLLIMLMVRIHCLPDDENG